MEVIIYPSLTYDPLQQKHLMSVGTFVENRNGWNVPMVVCVDTGATDHNYEANDRRERTITYVVEDVLTQAKELMMISHKTPLMLTNLAHIHYMKRALKYMPVHSTKLPQHQIDAITQSNNITKASLHKALNTEAKSMYDKACAARIRKAMQEWFDIAYEAASNPRNPACAKRLERWFLSGHDAFK